MNPVYFILITQLFVYVPTPMYPRGLVINPEWKAQLFYDQQAACNAKFNADQSAIESVMFVHYTWNAPDPFFMSFCVKDSSGNWKAVCNEPTGCP